MMIWYALTEGCHTKYSYVIYNEYIQIGTHPCIGYLHPPFLKFSCNATRLLGWMRVAVDTFRWWFWLCIQIKLDATRSCYAMDDTDFNFPSRKRLRWQRNEERSHWISKSIRCGIPSNYWITLKCFIYVYHSLPIFPFAFVVMPNNNTKNRMRVAWSVCLVVS